VDRWPLFRCRGAILTRLWSGSDAALTPEPDGEGQETYREEAATMNATTATCPMCGAPLKWGGQITMPEEDPRAGQPALFFFWLCGHNAAVPLDTENERRLQAVAIGHPARECGAADHDQPYRYRAPTADRPLPFGYREYARLLVLRGRAQDGAFADDGCPCLPRASHG
jgi:hypothetical protein